MTTGVAKAAFLGLNLVRIISLIVIILVFTTLIMGLVEDIRDYHNDENMDEARTEDCAYVPGTSIPMQTWGIFWVEFHRALLLLGVVALFFSELSWFGINRLENAAQLWFPILSSTRGLAALGCVHVVIATSILSHYLDEFPLVVSWMLFVIGICYLCLGIAFHRHPLKDGRSLFSQKRKRFFKHQSPGHVYRTLAGKKDYGATTSTEKPSLVLRNFLKRKSGTKTRSQAVSINETFPSLETESHRQVLTERARRAEHRRKTSSVAVDMSTLHAADQSSISRDFVWNAATGMVHEMQNNSHQHNTERPREMRNVNLDRRDSDVSASHSCSDTSVASSTQIRIGGYTSKEAALARERARRRRAAANSAANNETSYPPPSKSTGQSAKATSKMKRVKRSSLALVNTARNRLSAGTASALAARKRVSPAYARGIPNSKTHVVIEYIDDEANAPPVPPLPAYHQATKATADEVELPVASRFARNHVV
ncbi:uncharacterized protein MEPE_00570 [Melanopsichium pennsylvanicum]|uniref:Uncharacterized protein n=2 Tax=Melanopsichium pennsylvanicum TaxID=63383 RepID=A0AAJ4XGX2_9BASI|nr:conserved hypothetical protein [Melanopsichium pennsylvanicum 4]SNX81865.1 uncharacterized protein MEPE_00570 [Melanopsichium pennsylvanicum]